MAPSPSQLAIVTGVPGWLGTRLVESLINGLADPNLPDLSLKSDRPVRALHLANEDVSKLAHLGPQLTMIQGDLTTGEGLSKLFKDAYGATVFHAAGVIHPSRGCKQFYQVNVQGTEHLIQAASAAGIRRFVHVSSNSPMGSNPAPVKLFDQASAYNPYMHYGKSKKLGEDLVNKAGNHNGGPLETVIIRPPWFYGPGQPARQTLFFTMIRNGKVPIVGSGENLRSMAYIDNICQALMLCETTIQASGKTYWIADSQPYTMNQIVDTIEKLLETEFHLSVAHKRLKLPDMASQVAMLVDGALQELGLYQQKFHVLSEMNKNIACSIDAARRELGYNPQIALEEGMRRSIKYIIANGQPI
jgi:nucleoside-diphosphate-sugar epimerase